MKATRFPKKMNLNPLKWTGVYFYFKEESKEEEFWVSKIASWKASGLKTKELLLLNSKGNNLSLSSYEIYMLVASVL